MNKPTNISATVPCIGMTLSRDLMPQLDDPTSFLKYLADKYNIQHTIKTLDTKDLKSTQSEFDNLKIKQMMFSQDPKKPILASTDGHVLDGHHRWIADHNTTGKTKAYVIDHPVLELRKKAQDFVSLNEEITHKEFGPMLDSFMSFASNHLGIKSMPTLRYKDGGDDFQSFGGYNPSDKCIVLHTKNRHPMDIYRTLAHELVHHKQNEDGELKDVAKDGDTGSDIENAANSKAGIVLRHWAKKNPESFKLAGLVESKAIFVVGVPCSGKDAFVRELKEDNGFQELNIQTLHKTQITSENVLISAVAHDYDSIIKAKALLEHNGFVAEMIFVDVSNVISKLRNEQRHARGQRVINESVRFKKYEESKVNLEKFQELFEDVYKVINEEGLRQWFKSTSSDGKKGWVQIGGKYHGKPCARQPGQTSTPKCRSSSEAAKMTDKEIKYAVRKKRREDPNQPDKSGGAAPTRVATYKKEKKMNEEKDNPGKGSGTKDACYNKVKSRYKVWPSAYASGALVKCRKVGADNWGNKSVDEAFDAAMREEGTDSLRELYASETPGQEGHGKKKKIVRRKLNQEQKLDSALTPGGLPANGIGPEFSIAKSPSLMSGLGNPINESVLAWVQNPQTQERFQAKYGALAEQKLIEAAQNLNKISHTAIKLPKSVRGLREAWEALGGRDKGTVENSSSKEEIGEDWQKVNRQDKTDGLSQKAVNAYRRENPGSKLQTAVTEKNPEGKRAKRRASFCRRMKGMKKRLTSAETARDPDSRINKALRRWNCEE